MDQVEERSKKTLKLLGERTKKAYKVMRSGWREATEEDFIVPME
jgi:hypothetical protein